jgi:AcrR family transcriptional regulator
MLPNLHERKQQVVRDAIWEAATGLFAERGFSETTVDDIVTAAGVSRRSFFRYFESKNDLMAHGMVSYGDELIAAIEACPEDCSLREIVRETVMQVAQAAAGRPRTLKIMAIVSRYPDARAAQALRFAEVQDRVTEVLERRAKAAGEDTLAVRIAAGMVVNLAGQAVQWWYEHGQQDMCAAVEHTLSAAGRIVGGEFTETTPRRRARTAGRK